MPPIIAAKKIGSERTNAKIGAVNAPATPSAIISNVILPSPVDQVVSVFSKPWPNANRPTKLGSRASKTIVPPKAGPSPRFNSIKARSRHAIAKSGSKTRYIDPSVP